MIISWTGYPWMPLRVYRLWRDCERFCALSPRFDKGLNRKSGVRERRQALTVLSFYRPANRCMTSGLPYTRIHHMTSVDDTCVTLVYRVVSTL